MSSLLFEIVRFSSFARAAVFIAASFWLGGCFSSADAPGGASQVGAYPAPRLVADPRTPSSLEAMKKGLTSVTPPSSPLKDILFDFDTYDLRPDARQILKASAEWLSANPIVQIEIEGHTDEWGSSEYNLALGAKRAESAREYLVSLGISSERLKMVSYGEEAPACLEAVEECRQKNRRARFVILTVVPPS